METWFKNNSVKIGKLSNILPLFIKLLSYGAALLIIYLFFMESVKFLAIGYTIGVIVSIPVILLISKKNEEKTKKQISSEGDDNK